MWMMSDDPANGFCLKHEGHKANIKELCTFKRKLDGGEYGMGELERMWQAIERKVSKGMMITFAFLSVSLIVGLFGLVYYSNIQVLHDMVGIKVNIQLIMETLK
jgi:hypothetical protein